VIANQIEQIPVVVERLREIARALERGRESEPDRIPVVDRGVGRPVFVRVEEEQLVVAARFADRAAQRVAPDVALVDRLRVVVVRL
jgi:hypothetical protein